MKTSHIHTLLSLLFIILFLSGCYGRGVLVVPAETHSYSTTIITHHAPPHAPAHGHRHRHHDHDLQFDSAFGSYIVIDSPGLYFYNDHYMRFHNDRWQVTKHLHNKWRLAGDNDIPRKLKKAKRHNKKHRKEHREDHRDSHRDDHHDGPKHGHRRHHHNHELSFNSGVGAYIILKQPGIFFHNDRYIRHHRGTWQTTKKLNGRWRSARDSEIPRKLKTSKHAKKEKHQQQKKHDRKETSNGRHKEKWQ